MPTYLVSFAEGGRQSRHGSCSSKLDGKRGVVSSPKYPSAQFVKAVTFSALLKSPFVLIRSGLSKEAMRSPSLSRTFSVVRVKQVSVRYVDSNVKVVFPAGRLEMGMPNSEEYVGVKLLLVVGAAFHPS